MEKDKTYLYEMYNATSTEDGTTGELETYEAWLERQLLSRIKKLEIFDLMLDALNSLMETKKYKEEHGKDDAYNAKRCEAWEKGHTAMSAYKDWQDNNPELNKRIIHCHLGPNPSPELIKALNEMVERINKVEGLGFIQKESSMPFKTIEEIHNLDESFEINKVKFEEPPPTPSAKKKQKKQYKKPSKYM
jgi:hypothetical protein